MIDLDQVVLRRIDEAAAAYRFSRQHESEAWAPARLPAGLGRVRLRARCLAGDCARRVVGRHGYCHAHAQKIARGVALDRDVLLRRPASLATDGAHSRSSAPLPSRRAPFTPNVHKAP